VIAANRAFPLSAAQIASEPSVLSDPHHGAISTTASRLNHFEKQVARVVASSAVAIVPTNQGTSNRPYRVVAGSLADQ
jgi:predicted double-glycine peptidase